MDVKKLIEEYRFLIVELREYEKSKQGLVSEYKEIQKYTEISDIVVTHMRSLYSFYNERCEYMEGQIKRAERLLKVLDEPYYTIMFKRYGEGEKLETVADKMHYSRSSVSRKIKEAFEILGGVEDNRN